jgi:phosphoserine phosphatase
LKPHNYRDASCRRNDAGEYTGFEPEEPTSRDGGKARVIAMLKEKHGFQRVVMVGDGATDMQAKPPADATIGFGGVVVRDVPKKPASITNKPALKMLPLIISGRAR